MHRIATSAAAALLTAAVSAGAYGQAWIGQMAADNARSAQFTHRLHGRLGMSEREVREARDPAQALMSRYWALAAASDPADVTAAFRPSGQVRWSSMESEHSRDGLSRVHDSMARDEALALAPAPSSFARAGVEPGDTARGVWEVRARADPAAVTGYYYVEFQRDSSYRWAIATIVAIRAPAPGDTLLHPPRRHRGLCRGPGGAQGSAAYAHPIAIGG
jgi:SnoaL-like domain